MVLVNIIVFVSVQYVYSMYFHSNRIVYLIQLIGAVLLGEGIDYLIVRRFQNLPDTLFTFESLLLKYNNQNQCIEYYLGSNFIQNKTKFDGILCIIMILPGLIVLLIGFFGCSGAITQMQCLLYLVRYFYRFQFTMKSELSLRVCSIHLALF